MIRLNLNSIALLLFCSDIIVSDKKPLSIKQWNKLERKIHSSTLKEPSRLFGMHSLALKQSLDIDDDIIDIIEGRSSLYEELLYGLHNLQSKGINITTIYEDNYPRVLNVSLKKNNPLYLYYCGDLSLLNNMVSMIGLHQSQRRLYKVINKLLNKFYDDNRILVNGDNKGIEDYALKSYLKMGGKGIVFVSDNMIDKKRYYNKLIKDNKILLISAIDPYASFNISNALDTSIYISGLSIYQFVITSYINSGESWFSAISNIHNHYSQLLVYEDINYNGNIRLLELGAIGISKNDIYSNMTIEEIINKNTHKEEYNEEIKQMSIFDFLKE